MGNIANIIHALANETIPIAIPHRDFLATTYVAKTCNFRHIVLKISARRDKLIAAGSLDMV